MPVSTLSIRCTVLLVPSVMCFSLSVSAQCSGQAVCGPTMAK